LRAKRQSGAAGVFIFAALLLVLIAIGAALLLSRTSTAVQEQGQTGANLAKAAAALEQFASTTGRLPCPANPAVDDGLAVPDAATINCTYPQGTVPWRTIGMRRDDAFDAWGWKVSYRVYSNVTGGMTQDQGASMVNCDTVTTLGSAGVDANKLCRSTHATLPAEFIAGKGLSVTDFGTVYDGTKASGGAAYVLISHGASGLGGYTANGTQRDNPTSNDEKNNMQDTGPFTLKAATDATVAPSANTHFDDVLLYRTVADLAKRANLVARDWPDGFASLTFDSANVQAALGQASAPVAGNSLGVSTLRFFGANVSSGSGNISFDSVGGSDGIGVAGGGSSAVSGSESMSVTFAKPAGKLAITLNDFGGFNFFGFIPEIATLRFYSGTTLVSTTAISGCQTSIPGGGPLASFTVTPGASFDQVQITPFFSSFFLSAVKSCASTDPTCLTALDNGLPPASSGNHCDWP
jgi:hypothetical protein